MDCWLVRYMCDEEPRGEEWIGEKEREERENGGAKKQLKRRSSERKQHRGAVSRWDRIRYAFNLFHFSL